MSIILFHIWLDLISNVIQFHDLITVVESCGSAATVTFRCLEQCPAASRYAVRLYSLMFSSAILTFKLVPINRETLRGNEGNFDATIFSWV